MKKVLLISFWFPPAPTVHGRRIYRFASQLPKFGWIPFLVVPDLEWIADSEEPDFPEAVVSRVPYADWSSQVGSWGRRRGGARLLRALKRMPPDPEMSWIRAVCRRGMKIIREERIAVIYTSSFPSSIQLAGWWLKKRTGLPWVAEFTDEWVSHPDRARILYDGSKRRRWIEMQMERMVVRAANRVVVASPGYIQAFDHHLAPDKRSGHFEVITNSYDGDEGHAIGTRSNNGQFTIVYTGNLYYPSVNPEPFLTALTNLVTAEAIPADRLLVKFLGQGTEDIIGRYKKGQLAKCIQQTAWVPYKKALVAHREADIFLLILSPERGLATIPGKAFEYLRYGKPILALVPLEGESARLIRETGMGWVVDPCDVSAIENAVVVWYRAWDKGQLDIEPCWEKIKAYSAINTAKKLARVLDAVSSKKTC